MKYFIICSQSVSPTPKKGRIRYIEEAQLYIHAITFEFADKQFIAFIHENDEMTNVTLCYESNDINKTDIHIPAYFGQGFASDIYTMLYEHVEDLERERNRNKASYH